MTDLLDAVEVLTKPQRRRQPQDILEGGKIIGSQTVTVELPSLLQQLDDAIRSSMGGSTSGAKLAHESSPLDADALHLFVQIASQVRDWCRRAKVAPKGDPTGDLAAWYVSTLAHPMSPEVEASHVKQLTGWAGLIRGKLDPWREKDLPDACPECGAKSWWRDGAEFFRPLVVRYRPERALDATGLCRACDTVWNARELAYAIEQKEAANG